MAERARRALLGLEASVALMRPRFDSPFIVAAGWLCAGRGLWDAGFLFTAAALVLARGAANVINEILGREEDRLANPWLPLPSGLLDLRQALVTLAVIAAGVVAFTAAASPSRAVFAASLGLMILGGALIVGYSLMPDGWPAIAVAATPFPLLALIGWTQAQGSGWEIAAVLASFYCYGAASQIENAVRGIDGDREAGRLTAAVRSGPGRSLRIAAACDAGAVAAALAAATAQRRLAPVLPLAALVLGAVLAAYRDSIPRQESPGLRGRIARVREMAALSRARFGILVVPVAAFSTAAALALALIAAVTLPLVRRHERRVVGGALRWRLSA